MPEHGPNGGADESSPAGSDDGSPAGSDDTGSSDDCSLPDDVVEEAERLTRLARRASDDAEAAAYREERADLLAGHDYAALVRSEADGEVLVCHPTEWLVEGDVHPARVEDVERAVEVPLSGAGDPDDWAAVAEANETVAATVREAHGDVHGDNAAAYAEYVSNHYAKRLPEVTKDELRHFLEEYYARNVWPSDEQAAALERSIELVYEELSVPVPEE